MRKRCLKPIALVIALSFTSSGAIAAFGQRPCVYHGTAGGTHGAHPASATAQAGTHGAPAPTAAARNAAAASGSGHARHDHRAPDDSTPGDRDHEGGCNCLGQCLGGFAPPVLAAAETLRVPSVAETEVATELSDAETFRTDPPFLLPFANAPPAVS